MKALPRETVEQLAAASEASSDAAVGVLRVLREKVGADTIRLSGLEDYVALARQTITLLAEQDAALREQAVCSRVQA